VIISYIQPTCVVSRFTSLMHRGFRLNQHVSDEINNKNIENIILLESTGYACYQSLQRLVHNGQVRQQCYIFCQEIADIYQKLKQFFQNSFVKKWQNLDQFQENNKPDQLGLSAIGLIETGLLRVINKRRLYLSLLQNCDKPYAKTFEQGSSRSFREIKFLKNENNIQNNREHKVTEIYAKWLMEMKYEHLAN